MRRALVLYSAAFSAHSFALRMVVTAKVYVTPRESGSIVHGR
jgi:hypothetical protein